MIQLTRLRHDDVFFLNPDLIERIDSHVDTVVRLTNGSEYLVVESGQQIIHAIADFRAKVLALVPIVSVNVPAPTGAGGPDYEGPGQRAPIGELIAEGTTR